LDSLGAQGLWVCALAAVLSLVLLTISGKPIVGAFVFLFYILGGVGVRERSLYTAAMIFLMYLADGIVSGPSVVRVLLAALLFSNLRATRIASHSVPNSDQAVLPPRFNESWRDKLVDQLPKRLWPTIWFPYYIFSRGFLLLAVAGLFLVIRHRFA
jgi:hypothetical protein